MKKHIIHSKVDEVKKLLENNTSINSIAQIYNCNRRTLKRVIDEYGLPYNKSLKTIKRNKAYISFDEAFESGCPKNYTYKKFLIIERGHKCEKCNHKNWNGIPITLELHHIDGNQLNKSRENSVLLCPNCHEQTDNYRFRGKQHN